VRLSALPFGLIVLACRRDSEPIHPHLASVSAALDSLDSVRLAVLPDIMRLSEENMHGLTPAAAYCLSTSARSYAHSRDFPPSKALLTALVDHRPPIISSDDCTGRAWQLWAVATVLRPETAVVTGGYNAGPLAAAEWTCHARKEADKWIVSTPCQMNWIS
jgi:hypothetical protein